MEIKKIDPISLLAIVLTFISLILSISIEKELIMPIILVISFLILTIVYTNFDKRMNWNKKEIKRLNEKINIFERLSKLESKIGVIYEK